MKLIYSVCAAAPAGMTSGLTKLLQEGKEGGAIKGAFLAL